MYIRDKRSPTPKSEAVSRVMNSDLVRTASGSDRVYPPELLLRKALWSNGLRGYRLHFKIRLTRETRKTRPTRSTIRNQWVRPDISYVGKKLAIFVHGCFWH
ncbi:MAG: hypothetical protein KA746_04360 [Pyrinomonadaceae bacterium]|nr:hypothetical protein [Pyrinomonadaceae bacterium]MBP6213686.1 hypothetical protein [Pyrinomonadaceae bacterium]